MRRRLRRVMKGVDMLLLEHKNKSEVFYELPGAAAPVNSQNNNKKEETKMADVDTAVLSSEHGAIRHDVALAASNIRGDISATGQRLEKAVGDNRYTIASEAASLSKQVGAEACAINKNIGDARREAASETADIRYDLATRAGQWRLI